MLASVSLSLFYWRIANEPGVAEPLGLLWASGLTLVTGLMGTVTVNILFIRHKERRAWIAWVLNVVVSICYLPLLILTLVMMV
ncbi:MAG: hypothetical protein U5N58_06120 [Actinomycetota bacterium]|nr:hypothetical protein [Actinomycetota bacterium]